jgi:hypothetical protein
MAAFVTSPRLRSHRAPSPIRNLRVRPRAAGGGTGRSTTRTGVLQEVQVLCERDGGRLWGVSLCGPMVIGDMRTQTFARNH